MSSRHSTEKLPVAMTRLAFVGPMLKLLPACAAVADIEKTESPKHAQNPKQEAPVMRLEETHL
jgi:hypothetical protein